MRSLVLLLLVGVAFGAFTVQVKGYVHWKQPNELVNKEIGRLECGVLETVADCDGPCELACDQLDDEVDQVDRKCPLRTDCTKRCQCVSGAYRHPAGICTRRFFCPAVMRAIPLEEDTSE